MKTDPKPGLLRTVARALRGLFIGLLALLILFEEWGWDPLQRALAWVGRLPVLRQIEVLIRLLPPLAALGLLLLPSVLLVPAKLGALWLIANGHRLLGVSVIVLAKVVGTAIVARLFTLTRPALMRMPWFARLYARWTRWKSELLERVRASWVWRASRALKRAVQRRVAQWRAAIFR
ncbi:MAG: hypothetical protein IPP87_15380 [Ideonella sp.]|jgi:hypothetical protein|nr:hypothetical protein [Ideonella sp.]